MDIVDKLKSQIGDDVQHIFDHEALFKGAVAEIERLRAVIRRDAEGRFDAERYNWLRSRDANTISQGGVFAGMTPDNVILTEEDLDRAIDAAMGGK